MPSMIRAPAGACACAPASLMVLPSMTTVAFGTDPRPVPSMSVTPRMTSTVPPCADVERDGGEDECREEEKPFHDACSFSPP